MVRKTKRSPSKKRASAKKSAGRKGLSRSFWLKLSIVVVLVTLVVLAYTDALVRQKFDGKKWALPAQVYARPLELFDGQSLSARQLQFELQGLGYRQVNGSPDAGQYQRQGKRWRIHTRGFAFSGVEEGPREVGVALSGDGIVSLSGASLLRLEPQKIAGIYPAQREDRVLVQLQEVPLGLVRALVLIEDRYFWQHGGLSPRAIARALWANLRAGRTVQGGSTLTQQLVKNFYLTAERSLWRKGVEALMSVLLEVHYSKEEILETYINEVYLGQRGSGAVHGFALASEFYFHRKLENLAPHQYALLVALVKGASYYNPRRYPERAVERRNLVLEKLYEDGFLSESQWQHSRSQPLDVVEVKGEVVDGYPAYLDLVKRQLHKDYQDEDLRSEGLRIFTNFDPWVQHQAEQVLSRRLAELGESMQAALVSVQRGTGAVQAVVGDRQVRFAGFNRALDAKRSVGSLVKPAIYLTALERPDYSLATLVSDAKVKLPQADGSDWQPQNFDGKVMGELPMYRALALSRNLTAVNVGLDLGVEAVIATLQALGLEAEPRPLPALFLGSLSLSPLEVAQLYHTLAAEGFYSPLTAIREVLANDGSPLRRYPYQVEQRFDPKEVHLLQYAMQMVLREGTAKSAYRWLPREFVAAGKTGTSNEQRDSWFAGFSDDRVSVVWVGRDDNQPTWLTGASGALPIWAQFTAAAGDRSLRFSRLEGLEYLWVDRESGKLSGENCHNSVLLPFVPGTTPAQRGPCEYRENPLWHWFKALTK